MASGDTLFALFPAGKESGSATLDTRNAHLVLDFDAATDEDAVFPIFMPRHYGGGGITCTIVWMASTATANEARWDISLESHTDDVDDLDTDSFAAVQSVDATTASASGEPAYDTIAFTDGAQMDSLVVGESGRLKLNRDANHANDDMAGDAELLRIEVKET